MPREPETYRQHLEDILKFFDNKRILSVSDVATYLGKTRNWTREHLGITSAGITAVSLANKLAKYSA